MLLSSLPAKIAAIFAASAPPTAKNTIPLTQAGIAQPGQASFDVGFPAITMQPAASGGINPYGQDFNGIINAITGVQQWQSAGGLFPFDSTFSTTVGGYPLGAVLMRANGTGYWQNTVDGNTANPDTGGAGWLPFAPGWTNGTDTGAANACVVNFTPAVPTLIDGMVLWFKAAAANTGATTINVNGLGVKPVVGGANSALQGGEIVANGKCMVVYSASLSSFILIECTGAAIQVAPATQSQHSMQLGQATGRLIGIRVITSTQVYTPTPGTSFIVASGVGGGGAGGGSGTTAAAQVSAAPGGGGGGYFKKRINSGFAGATATIGAGGMGFAANAGGSGGTTSFGSFASASGGIGGGFGTQTTNTNVQIQGQALGGTGSNGDVNAAGGSGQYAVWGPAFQISGQGGSSIFGAGATWVFTAGDGVVAVTPGSGGSGSCSGPSYGANRVGGNGAAGLILIEEYA